eukprot:ANDGO_02513.mRNA.1 hypothetical protein CAOG_00083
MDETVSGLHALSEAWRMHSINLKSYVYTGIWLVFDSSYYAWFVMFPRIKDDLGYSQTEMNILGGMMYFGCGILQMVPSLLVNRLKDGKTYSAWALTQMIVIAELLITLILAGELPSSIVFTAALFCVCGALFTAYCTAQLGNCFEVLFKTAKHPVAAFGVMNAHSSALFAFVSLLFIVYYVFVGVNTALWVTFALFTSCAAVSSVVQTVFTIVLLRYQRTVGEEKQENIKKEQDALVESTPAPPVAYLGFAMLSREPLSYVVSVLFLFSFGNCVTFFSNSGEILLSAGGSKSDSNRIVLVFVAVQLVARIASAYLAGLGEDIRNVLNEYVLIGLTNFLMVIISLLGIFFWDSIPVFYVSLALDGLAYGLLWPIVFSIANTSFPKYKYETVTCTVGNFTVGIGPLLFGLVTGMLYDQHADSETHDCYGQECFRDSYYISLATSAFTALLAWFVARPLHRRMIQSDQ